MLPFVTFGITEASTTLRPDVPSTPIVAGSVTASGSVPSRAVPAGCNAVSASRATQSMISSSDSAAGPGDSSRSL